MTVSIIIPYYNAAKYIEETVRSIVAQTFPDWELIIVDDCSTDSSTSQVLSTMQAMDSRIRTAKTERNCGAGATRNVGIKLASGRYIAFCDSDDWWYPTKLEEQLSFMMNEGHVITCTYYEDARENLEPYYVMHQAAKQDYKMLLRGCNIGTPGVIYDTEALGKCYFPNLRRAEDWGCWMQILRKTDYIYTLPKPLWKYRHIAGSETSNKRIMMQSVVRMYKEVLGFSSIKAWLYGIFVFLPNNVLKKVKKIAG